MPFIEINFFEEGTRKQKVALVNKITDAFVDIIDAPKDQVWIVFGSAYENYMPSEKAFLDNRILPADE